MNARSTNGQKQQGSSQRVGAGVKGKKEEGSSPRVPNKSRVQGGAWLPANNEPSPKGRKQEASPIPSTPTLSPSNSLELNDSNENYPFNDSGSNDSNSGGHVPSPAKTTISYQKHTKKNFDVIQPGLVLLQGAIDWETQKWLIDICFSLGKSTTQNAEGFYEEKNGLMVLNQGSRGRVIKDASIFPEKFVTLCHHFLQRAREIDKSLPGMTPNTVLINYYNEKASFKWHKDSEDPNLIKMRQGKPIISLSIGQSANFAYKNRYEDKEFETIRLNSGDVLIFGGPSRMIVHSVTEIIGRTLPAPIISNMRSGRLNITVRDIGNGKIDRSQFPAYRVVYETPEGQNKEDEKNE